jgi:hypothetical protein
MRLRDLNNSVTEAILRAERLPAGTWEAESAFLEVAELEEAIADLTSAEDLEGEIARLGAVRAALTARNVLRAALLAERYTHHGLAPHARAVLDALRVEIEAELAKVDAPIVKPIAYRLRTTQ